MDYKKVVKDSENDYHRFCILVPYRGIFLENYFFLSFLKCWEKFQLTEIDGIEYNSINGL